MRHPGFIVNWTYLRNAWDDSQYGLDTQKWILSCSPIPSDQPCLKAALPTQDDVNTEETRSDIFSLSETRTHDHFVWAWEDILYLRQRGIVIGVIENEGFIFVSNKFFFYWMQQIIS